MKKPDTPYISKSKGTPIFESEENELYSYRKDETKVPIHLKVTLTIKEAAEYSNIGINKIREISNNPRCNFVIFVGKKRLIKRKEFEKFISDNVEL